MKTECTHESLEFHAQNRRVVQARFDGGFISSDGGGLLLREVEHRTRILSRLADCFTDHRDPRLIEHPVSALIKQRVYGLALGYEDLNDHDQLRLDPLLAVLCDKPDPLGKTRDREQDKGKALAGKSTLNRLELTPASSDEKQRYKKISADFAAMDDLLMDVFLESHEANPGWITLDVDATDDRVHGAQEGVILMLITVTIVTCHSTFSVAMMCYAPAYAQRVKMAQPVRWKPFSASLDASVNAGLRCVFCCGETVVFAVKN